MHSMIRNRRLTSVGAVALLALGATALVPMRAVAAPADVVISEIMYNPLSDVDGDEFLELANPGATAADVSGWCFGGITLCLPTGTSIAAHGFLVVSPDAARFQSTYGFAPDAVYTGKLSNSGEPLTLSDAGGALVDSVSFTDMAPWPVTPDGLGTSLELIDPSLNNDDPLNWAASTASRGYTPGAVNAVADTGLRPRISDVAATPAAPAPGQAVTVNATITGVTSATLRYKVDFGAEVSKPLTSTGGDTYTGSIPGVPAGHLIRYRIEATNAVGTSSLPRVDDSIVYQGVVASSGVSSALPVFEWFIDDADYSAITSNPTQDITRSAVLAYNGVVYDNVSVNIRGAITQTAPKPNWKFELPHNHDLDMPGYLADPVDEFAMQADWSDHSHGHSLLSWNAFKTAGVANTQEFPVRTQRNAKFQGLYLYLDLFDGTWRDREGYSDKQFYKASHGAFEENRQLADYRFEKKNPEDGDYTPLRSFLSGVEKTGSAQRDYLLANANLPQMLNDAAVWAIVKHVDSNSKNFYLSQDPATGRWSMIPWDLDKTWDSSCCGVTSNFVTPAEPGDTTLLLNQALLAQPEWRAMYFRRLQTLVGQILATGKLEAVYDAQLGPAKPEAALDMAAWPTTSWMSYDKQRTALFGALNARRSVFANDSRMPAPQSAAPNIVINEIQHSPTAGGDAEFLELYNPSSTEAVDLSGWSVSDAIALQIQPGTVILPHATMVFAANDPVFRSTYGSTVFVGGTYKGGLSSAETVTLKRVDGSTADAVSYGGAGWPQVTAGQSLELQDPASDNNNPASWALSTAGGSPGAPNSGSVAQTPPGAPTIGTATAGDGSATVSWTAPGNDGGSAVTGYQVRVVDATNQQVGALHPAGASATSLVVTGLANGTTYRLQVAAVNAAGTGSLSAASNTVTPAAAVSTVKPPVIGTAAPGAAGGSLTAVAKWVAPKGTGTSAITGYRVTALTMSSSAADATVLASTDSPVLGKWARSRTFTLRAGNYRFQVVAISPGGTSVPSARSNNVVPR